MKIITNKQVLVNGKKYSSADGIGVEPKPAPLPAGWSVINPNAPKTTGSASSVSPKAKKDGTKAMQFAKDSGLLEIGQNKLKQLLGLEQTKKTTSQNKSGDSTLPAPETEKKSSTNTILLVVGGVAILGGIIYFATRGKRK